jgi:argininosuccinate synthase
MQTGECSVSAFRDFIGEFKRGYRRERYRQDLKTFIDRELTECLHGGVRNEFERGKMCAFYRTWEAAGYSDTTATINARALISPEETSS